MHVRTLGMQRSADPEILARGQSDDRVIITSDHDFAKIMAARRMVRPSVITLRLRNCTPGAVTARLLQVLLESGKALRDGALVTVEDSRYRVRPLPVA